MDIFTTEGRLNRQRYILYALAIGIAANVVSYILTAALDLLGAMIGMFIVFATIIPSIFLAIRRFHDLDRPGSHAWFLLIPFYNIYIAFVLLFQKGTDGPNQYGEDPLAQPLIAPSA
jgi:uncharacterized membrane protein YhaH (DUF805 family)